MTILNCPSMPDKGFLSNLRMHRITVVCVYLSLNQFYITT